MQIGLSTHLKKAGCTCIAFLLFSITGSSLHAQTTYYVNDGFITNDQVTSNIGNDANPGTAAAPFATITKAVTVATAGDHIIIDAGTYAERVTVNKSLTIQGVDSATVILDQGDANYNITTADNNGFTVTADDITITNFKIRNYVFAITNTAPVSNLVINKCTLIDNNSAGFYSGASLNGFTISNCIIRSNANKAGGTPNSGAYKRGVFLQSRTYTNIVMTGNIVTGHLTGGLDVNLSTATSGVTITNNSLSDNGDSEIGVWLGTSTPTSNPVLVDNNNISMSGSERFGIEIKNPNGTGESSGIGSVVVSNNTISGYAGSGRDMGGIVVIRRKDGYTTINDQPQGVVITGNTISNMQNLINDAFGIVVGGIGHTISGNTINNTEISIQLQKGNDGYLTDDNSNQDNTDLFFSRDNSKDVCAFVDNNTIDGSSGAPRLVTGVSTSSALLPATRVQNTTSGVYFCTIQQAISFPSTADNDVVVAQAGTYAENITLDKKLSLRGAKYNINPNTITRDPAEETILYPSFSHPMPYDGLSISSNTIIIEPTASGSAIDGFTFDGDNPALETANDTLINEGANHAHASALILGYGINNVTVTNNIFKNSYFAGISFDNSYVSGAPATTGNIITHNLFTGIRPCWDCLNWGEGIDVAFNCYTNIADNVIQGTKLGMQTSNFYESDPGTSHTISNNTVTSVRKGIWHNNNYSNCSVFNITGNSIATFPGAPNNWGIAISSVQSNVTANVSNNAITGARYGYELWNNPTSDTVSITGGTVTGCINGIVADNFEGYNSNATSSSYIIDNVNISATDTGIIVRDDSRNTNNATVGLTIKNNTVVNVAGGTNPITIAALGSDAFLSLSGINGSSPTIINLTGGNLINPAGNAIIGDSANIVVPAIQSVPKLSLHSLTLTGAAASEIASGANDTLTITGGTLTSVGTLTTNHILLKSTATETASIGATGGINNGAAIATLERYIPGGKRAFRFLGHPFSNTLNLSSLTDDILITGGTSTGFTVSGTNNPSAFWYDVTTGTGDPINDVGWTAFTSADGSGTNNTWAKYQGIRVLVRGNIADGLSPATPSPVTLDATGTLNTGDQTIALTKGTNSGFNLISNPFASAINLTTVGGNVSLGSNLTNTFWVWNPNGGTLGTYENYTFNTSYILPSFSSFFVQTSANDNITIKEAAKTTDAATSLFGNDDQLSEMFTLTVKDNKAAGTITWDKMDVLYDDKSSVSLDLHDGTKMYNSEVNLYSITGNNKLSIDSRPYNAAGETIPLGFTSSAQHNYTIVINNYNLDNGKEVYLHDKYNNSWTLIENNATYDFTTTSDTATQGENRFELVQKQAPVVIPVTSFSVKLAPNPASDRVKIIFSNKEQQNTIITLANAEGKTIKIIDAGNVQSGTITIDVKGLAKGVYYILFNGKNSQKLVVE